MIWSVLGAVLLAMWVALITWWASPFSETRKERYRERQRVVADLRRTAFAAIQYAAQSEYVPQHVGQRAQLYGPGNGNAANLGGQLSRLNAVLNAHRFDLPDHHWVWGNKLSEDYDELIATEDTESYNTALRQCIQDYLHIAGRKGRARLDRMEVHSENEASVIST